MISEKALVTEKHLRVVNEALARGSDVQIEHTKYGVRIIELKVKVLAKAEDDK